MSAEVARCPKKRCREIMTERPGPFGQLTWICVPCEVNAAGFCRRCPSKLPPKKDGTNKGRRKYCVPCRRAVEADQDKQRYWNDDERRESQVDRQRRRREDPVIYAGMIQKQRDRYVSRAGTYDDLDRLYRRTHAKNRRAGAPRVTVDRRKQVAA